MEKLPVSSEEIKVLEEEVTTLLEKSKKLEKEIETKKKEVNVAEVSAVALRKQSEGFLLEYDRLLEENQNLRSSLQSLDWRGSSSYKSLWVLVVVSIIKPRKTRTESADNTSINPAAARVPFTSCAYPAEARARNVIENEDVKKKRDKKKSILDVVSKAPEMEFKLSCPCLVLQ
ncbi:hypothetical protein LWI28_024425 [Acer negundo]|uniref:Endoplasmic reticulum transmembrane protein n=1 Tax=Acer negundo TaxID=4023 RepID=A0AAD5P3S1_ACENE|nr:hypothetical protein LWI28_024425 [Acer negundo]